VRNTRSSISSTARFFSSSTPFVGRDDELARCLRVLYAVAEPESSGGAVLLITGEAGIGKTRLVSELLARANGIGWQSLVGRSFEQYAGVPYFTFAEALEPWFSRAPSNARVDVLQRWPDLAHVIPQAGATSQTVSYGEVSAKVTSPERGRPPQPTGLNQRKSAGHSNRRAPALIRSSSTPGTNLSTMRLPLTSRLWTCLD